MRINIIGNFNPNTGLTQDANILRGLLSLVYGQDVVIGKVQHTFPHCPVAEINFFLEVVNPSLFLYAKKNIWIPNLEWTYKTWTEYLPMFDEVWVKTHEAEKVFAEYTPNVKYINWTSFDKVMPKTKNYSKAVLLVGKNIYRAPKPVFQAYSMIEQTDSELFKKLPMLHIPYDPERMNIRVPQSIETKVTLIDRVMKDGEYNDLIQECGLAICTSVAEGFCHAVNEAMSAGCNLMLTEIEPFKELSTNAYWVSISKHINDPVKLGNLCDSSVESIIIQLRNYCNDSFKSKRSESERVRREYEERHESFLTRMKTMFPTVDEYSLEFPKEDQLPDVSIITLTRDRRDFMELAKYCYTIQNYPSDKLEWVIVDDGEDSIEDTLIGVPNVTYVRLDTQLSIGEKRNIGVSKAMYDIIVMMDDDDVYPESSVTSRVAMLMANPAKECAFCSVIPCYDITKFSSFMNVPPISLHMSERVSEATLIFTKKFWEERQFSHEQIAEGNTFVRSRELKCREMTPQDIIVSLTHPRNTSNRKIPNFKEPNGCHYGFNEKLFLLVTEIGKRMV